MWRAYTLRLRLNKEQTRACEDILLDSVDTYNAALQERKEAWKLQRKRITYCDQTAELTQLRKDPQFATIAYDIQKEPLRRLDKAFTAFFRRCRSGEKPGYPRFKSKDRYNSFAFARPHIKGKKIHVPRLGWFKFRANQVIEGKPKRVIIKRIGVNWIVRLVCDLGVAPEKIAVRSAVGIDVGISAFVTLSDGTAIETQRRTSHFDRIAAANRILARKKRGSRNRLRAKERLRRANQGLTDSRRNFIHHVSKWLVSRYDLIAFEKLNVKGMVHGTFAGPIQNAAWAELLYQISYKAESAGRYAIAVNPRGTSIRCSGCGEPVPKTLADRQHNCVCGVSLGRDHNAALNILALGNSAAGLVPPERVVSL